MNSGMYAALSGNSAALKRMDIISNNLANVNTPGFKKDRMLFESMLASNTNPPAVPQSMTADPVLQKDSVFIDYGTGTIAQTGNTFDLAINGDGFFVVNTPNGPAYTRQGNFKVSAAGTLVTADGYPVMGDGGPVRVPGSMVAIDPKGMITSDGEPLGTISLVDFPRPYNLEKIGNAQFIPATPGVTPQPATGTIMQGHLEGSNVETVSEMVQLIETNRYFDFCSKVVRSYDDMAAKATNELGKL